jgi:hypothetical protein
MYKIQLRHEIKVTDYPKCVMFAVFMLSEIDVMTMKATYNE